MAPQPKTESEMFPLVESWLKSSQTQKQFCTSHGLPVHILVYWAGRYRKSHSDKPAADKVIATEVVAAESKASKAVVARDGASGFIRLSTPPAPAPVPALGGSMEVILPTGAIIRFSATVPADYLKELLSACSH